VSKREIASLACKILGIYMIIQGINVMGNIISFSLATPNQLAPGSLINIILPFIFLFVFGILLWFLSDKLSAIIVRGETNYIEGLGIKTNDLQRVSFSVLGLYFLGSSLPKIVSALTNMYSMTMSGGTPSTARLLLVAGGPMTEFIVGLGIFLGSQGLVNFLESIRAVGLKREDDREEND